MPFSPDSVQLDVAADLNTLLQALPSCMMCCGVDTLICDGKTLRGLIHRKPGVAAMRIAHLSVYSQQLCVVIAQATYATATVEQLQEDALHSKRPFLCLFRRRALTF
jgi:hypothetical protein